MKSIQNEIEEQKILFETNKILAKVEYFDDRFYKLEQKLDYKIPDSFNPNHVHFRDDGIDLYLPSVTTILNVEPKPYLSKWRGDVGNREADLRMLEAQERGSYIHYLCSKLTEGKTIIYQNIKQNFPTTEAIQNEGEIGKDVFVCHSQDIMVQVARFDRLLDILKPKILDVERNVYYIQDIFYAGTVDYIMEIETGDYQISTKKSEHIEGGIYVCDLKTGNSCDKNYFLQTIAYTKALNMDIKGNIIIHTNSDNKTGIEGVKLFVETDLESYWKQFKIYYKTFQFINKEIKPKLFEIPYLLRRKEI
jgi:hypothetical protein